MKKVETKRYSSIENALRILKTFSMHEPKMRLIDIAEELNIAKSTAHRLFTTMASEGFISKDPQTNQYSLGASVLSLTNIVNSQLPIINEATPILNALTEMTGESSNLGIREGSQLIYLQKVESEYPIEVKTHIGRRNPLHCTATGQTILAFESDEVIREILSSPLEKFTKSTITDNKKLLKRLKGIREIGYVIDFQGFEKHIVSIGAPIFNEKNEIVAAVSITGPIKRLKQTRVQKRCINGVLAAAEKITGLIQSRKSTNKGEKVI